MSAPVLTPQPLPAGVVSLLDHATHAQTTMDAPTWAYLFGAAADEITLESNLAAWRRIALLPRVLRPLAGGHTRIELLGRTLSHPILIAPMAYQQLAHPGGEHATALAAAALGAGMVLSTLASSPLDAIASSFLPITGRGPLWFQLYLQEDRRFTADLVQRAESAGYEALVLTVDAPVQGVRDRERRTGFQLPAHVQAVNLATLRPAPRTHHLGPTESALFDGLLRHAPSWDDIAWLRSITQLPVLLKGILHPDDAREALASGASGLIVSNHGGRTLDTAVSTATALPAIAQVVRGEIPILVDGGIRRGTDVLKAIALGANAVLVGRPVLHGLANAGATGVAHVLRLMRDELEVAMALCGCRTLDQANQALLTRET